MQVEKLRIVRESIEPDSMVVWHIDGWEQRAMDLRQLRYFVRVADAGSFSSAAHSLHVTQPALGLQIRKLEQELGAPLFLRHARGVVLTEAGKGLRCSAEALLEGVELARQRVRDLTRQPTGTVTLGVIGSMGLVIVPELVRRCKERFPGIDLIVVEGVSAPILDCVEAGRHILGLSGLRRTSSALVFEPLVVEAPVFVGPAGDAVASKAPISFTRAVRYPLVLPTSSHMTRQVVDQTARKLKVAANLVFEVDSMSLRKELVLNASGYSILPITAVHREISTGTLFARQIVRPRLLDPIYLVHSRSRPLSLCGSMVRNLILELAREAIAEGSWHWQRPKRN